MVERIGKEGGRLLAQEADYYPETSFSPDESLDAMEKAATFVRRIKEGSII